MSEREDPERLLEGGGSDLERCLIGAIAGERPSPELRDRMAQALGVPLAAAGLAATVAASQTAATAKTAAGIGAGAGGTAPLAWISVGVVSLVLAGAIVGARVWKDAPAKSLPAPVTPAPLPVLPPSGARPLHLPGLPAQSPSRTSLAFSSAREQTPFCRPTPPGAAPAPADGLASPADGDLLNLLFSDRTDGPQHIHFLIADFIGIKGHHRFHGDQGQDLH